MKKNLITFILILSLTGCATVRRHPVLYGIATGVAVGVTIALIEKRGHCPGEYVTGDPPCPPPVPELVRH